MCLANIKRIKFQIPRIIVSARKGCLAGGKQLYMEEVIAVYRRVYYTTSQHYKKFIIFNTSSLFLFVLLMFFVEIYFLFEIFKNLYFIYIALKF